MSGNTRPRTAPFPERPCQCCQGHTPVPLEVELHHVLPQYAQRALWGELRDRTTIPMCRSSHRNLHVYLTALLAGKPLPRVNPYTARWARGGRRRIVEAYAAAGVPLPPGGGGE